MAPKPPGPGSAAPSRPRRCHSGMEVRPVNVRDAPEIERGGCGVRAFRNGGLIVTASGLTFIHRNLIIMLAARHRLPAVYCGSHSVARRRPHLLWG